MATTSSTAISYSLAFMSIIEQLAASTVFLHEILQGKSVSNISWQKYEGKAKTIQQ